MVSHSRIHAKLSPIVYANQAVSYVCEVVTWGGLTPQTTARKGGFLLLVDPLINFMDINPDLSVLQTFV